MMAFAVIMAILATVVGVWIAWQFATCADTPLGRLGWFVGVLVALYTVANLLVGGPSVLENKERTTHIVGSPYEIVTSHFGLESEAEYPLNLGSRFSGTSGQVSVSGGLFYTHGEGSWNPVTSLSLGFQNNSGKSWILEIPMSRVTFIQDPSAEPSVKITLKGAYDLGITAKVNPGCELQILAGWWHCSPKGETVTTYPITDDLERAGLAPVLAQAFAEGNASAEITLTPEQYNTLLNS